MFDHLADPDVVAYEERQFSLDPYSPVAAWKAAYTMCVVENPDGTVVRREVAAGIDVLDAMAIPAALVAAALRGDAEEHEALVGLVERLGPVSVRVALCAGIESLVKTNSTVPHVVAPLVADPPDTPIRAALRTPFDIASPGAVTFLAGTLAAIDDPVPAVFEAASLLQESLVAAYGADTARAAVVDHAARWPTLRYYDADGNRATTPE